MSNIEEVKKTLTTTSSRKGSVPVIVIMSTIRLKIKNINNNTA